MPPPRTAAPLALCYGTRPQVIKASLLIEALGADHPLLTVDTGQHYDYELNAGLYEALGVRRPDCLLDVGSGSHARQTGAILERAADAFLARQPAAVIVIGDTNSTLGCALAAAQLRIPVAHVEAGLRAADRRMAEDLNRRLVDELSSLLCAPSRAAEDALRAQAAHGLVVRTGDIACDVLLRNAARAASPAAGAAAPGTPGASAPWPLGADEPSVFVTLHRAELVDDTALLRDVMAGLSALDLPVVFAVHPRTRPALADPRVAAAIGPRVRLLPPLGYLETIAAVRDAPAVVTDSGGIQREAYWLGTPCITVRAETEWGETLALGANVLVPPARARAELARVVHERAATGRGTRGAWDRTAYGEGDAAPRIAAAVRDWLARG